MFNNADSSGTTDVNDPSYSELLPGIDALGGKLDSTLSYKLVNRSSGNILSVFQGSISAGALLDAGADGGLPTRSQQWRITSNLDGYFQIASLNPGAGNTTNVLDDSGGATTSGSAVVQSAANGSKEQEWDVVSAGNGYFNVMSHLSSLVLDTNGGSCALAGFVGAGERKQQCPDPTMANRSGALKISRLGGLNEGSRIQIDDDFVQRTCGDFLSWRVWLGTDWNWGSFANFTAGASKDGSIVLATMIPLLSSS